MNPVKSPSISLVASPAASPRAASITAARSPHNRSQSPQFYAGIIYLLYITVMWIEFHVFYITLNLVKLVKSVTLKKVGERDNSNSLC